MAKDDGMKMVLKAQQASWTKRWEMLSIARFQNDYEVAELANEIRMEFPKGDSGDFQFQQWINRHLKGARGPLMLKKAIIFEKYTRDEWKKYGGWMGVQYLEKLTNEQRHRLKKALPGEGPYHYSTIRKRGMKLGIYYKGPLGRDTRSKSENRVNILRMFLVKLYKKRDDLPPLPAEVRQAMTPTVLSMIPADVRA